MQQGRGAVESRAYLREQRPGTDCAGIRIDCAAHSIDCSGAGARHIALGAQKTRRYLRKQGKNRLRREVSVLKGLGAVDGAVVLPLPTWANEAPPVECAGAPGAYVVAPGARSHLRRLRCPAIQLL